MSDWQFRPSYSEGVAAGDRLLALLARVDPDARDWCESFMAPGDQEELLGWFWSRISGGTPLPYVAGFLSRTLKYDGLYESLISLFGAEEIVFQQGNMSPICDMPTDSGFVQLGFWTGDWHDGDAWCLDGLMSVVRCVGPGGGSADLDRVRANSYAVLPSFDYWVEFLCVSARQRGWLDNKDG